MSSVTSTLADDACYLALKARDARFDGCFFTGVTSTGIYCRPVCSVKTPQRKNCLFFRHAAQAEHAGFRPCLRCRPELAPHSVAWSVQDASFILAHQAARLLDQPEMDGHNALASDAQTPRPIIATLAQRLGVSDRHVRRLFETQFGVSPLQYLQTRRLLTAKQLLTDTDLAVAQVALMSGFASVRRFNAAFTAHYHLNPTQLRRQRAQGTRGEAPAGAGITVRLGYRPPYDVAAMLGFLATRAVETMELVSLDAHPPFMAKTMCLDAGTRRHAGAVMARFDTARCQLVLQVSESLRDVLPLVIHRVRALFDLDADPASIHSVLQGSFPGGEGLRVPGTLDGFELAVRAVLGQQITVAAARTLARRLVEKLGEPVQTPWPQLTRCFPTPAVLAAISGDTLGQLGIVRQRQGAITSMAKAVADGRLHLHGGADVKATVALLKSLPGIGEWTANYIAMRALRWPDAFLAADVALHKPMQLQGRKDAAKQAEQASLAWKPWRSYAVIRAWAGLLTTNASAPTAPNTAPRAEREIISENQGHTDEI